MPSRLLSTEHTDTRADVLVITNMWPNEDRPDYGIFVKRQVDSLIEAGLRCDVLFIRGYRSPLAYPLAAARLAWLNLRRRYALVHGHGGETALAARFYMRAPVLVSYCGDDLLGTPRADGTITTASRLRRSVLRVQSRLLSRTLTKSSEMGEALPARVRARNAVVPNGVDRELFTPTDRAAARTALGWDPDERVVLFAADPAVERKRHWLAAAATEIAAEQLGGARLHVATGISPEQMPMLMSAADCLILTSAIEGSPNVVKEALMCDLPVIATDVGDVRELLEPVEPSWVCEATPEALGEALADCFGEPFRRSNGRERSERLGSKEIAARVLALYDELSPGAVAALPAGD